MSVETVPAKLCVCILLEKFMEIFHAKSRYSNTSDIGQMYVYVEYMLDSDFIFGSNQGLLR